MNRILHSHKARRRSDQRGITLLELIVAMAVLAIIMVPLTMAFIQLLRESSQLDRSIGRSADAQRIGAAWTQDVHNVEAGGINRVMCSAPTNSLGESTLVSFSWDSAVGAGGQKVATWVVVGSGPTAQLIRRYCSPDAPMVESVLAETFGTSDGRPMTQILKGPSADNPRDFCPFVDGVSDSCSMIVDGAFSYRIDVTRRNIDTKISTTPFPPPAPTITGAEGKNRFITVSWSPPSIAPEQPGIAEYSVKAYLTPVPDGSSPQGDPDSGTADGEGEVTDITGLTNGVKYYLEIRAKNLAGMWSEPSTPRYGPVIPVPGPPGRPVITDVFAGDGSIVVAFNAPSDDGGLIIRQWHAMAKANATDCVDDPDVADDVVDRWVDATLNQQTGEISITGLTNGTPYAVCVSAKNDKGEGLPSDARTGIVPFTGPPAPTDFYAQGAPGGAELRWTNNDDPEGLQPPAVKVRVRAYLDGSATPVATKEFEAQNGVVPSTGLFDGLVDGLLYRFDIVAVNESGGASPGPPTTSLAWPRNVPNVDRELIRPSSAPVPAPNVKVAAWTGPPCQLVPGQPPTAGNVPRAKITATWEVPPSNGGEPFSKLWVAVLARSVSPTLSGWSVTQTLLARTNGNTDLLTATGCVDPSLKEPATPGGATGPYKQFRVVALYSNKAEWAPTTERWAIPTDPPANGTAWPDSWPAGSPVFSDYVKPVPPTIGTPAARDASAEVNWTGTGSGFPRQVAGYRIRAYEGCGSEVFATRSVTAPFTPPYPFTGLTNGQSYCFDVATINDVGDVSADSSLVKSASVTPSGAPTVPTELQLTYQPPPNPGEQNARGTGSVTFKPPTFDGGAPLNRARFRIVRRTVPPPYSGESPGGWTDYIGYEDQRLDPYVPGGANPTWTRSWPLDERDDDTPQSSQRYFQYQFFVGVGNTGWRPALTYTFGPDAPSPIIGTYPRPTNPASISAAVSWVPGDPLNGAAALTWSAGTAGPGSRPIDKYRIRAFQNGAIEPMAERLAPGDATTFTFGGLPPDNTYSFDIASVDDLGGVTLGPWANSNGSVVRLTGAPQPPTAVSFSATQDFSSSPGFPDGKTSFAISWASSPFNGGEKVKLVRVRVMVQSYDNPGPPVEYTAPVYTLPASSVAGEGSLTIAERASCNCRYYYELAMANFAAGANEQLVMNRRWGPIVSSETIQTFVKPTAPQNVVLQRIDGLRSGELMISWAAPSNPGGDPNGVLYDVVCNATGGATVQGQFGVAGAHLLEGFTPNLGSPYVCEVTASNRAGTSPPGVSNGFVAI